MVGCFEIFSNLFFIMGIGGVWFIFNGGGFFNLLFYIDIFFGYNDRFISLCDF